MKVKLKNVSDETLRITGFAEIPAGSSVTVGADEAKVLLGNPHIQEVSKKSSSFRAVDEAETSEKL